MSDSTPITKQVREDYATRMAPHLDEARREAFDRWLEQVKAEAWEEGRLASDTAWEHEYDGHPAPERESYALSALQETRTDRIRNARQEGSRDRRGQHVAAHH